MFRLKLSLRRRAQAKRTGQKPVALVAFLGSGLEMSGEEQCAVCYECPRGGNEAERTKDEGDVLCVEGTTYSPQDGFAHLPCCGGGSIEVTTSTKLCTGCILQLCEFTVAKKKDASQVVHCPRCRHGLRVQVIPQRNTVAITVHGESGEIVV